MRVLTLVALVLSLGSAVGVSASDARVPLQLLSLEPSHHALLVDKAAEKLFLYEGHGAEPATLVRAWNATTGQKGGDKTARGDLKTPVGIYFFTEILEDHQLPAEYGLRALVMDYPNLFDRRSGKTGSGIWLHATDERTRPFTSMRTRGCVVVTNQDVLDISRVVRLHETPIIVDDEVQLVDVPQWKAARDEVVNLVQGWARSWSAGDFKRYGSYYAADYQADGKGRRAWLDHKRSVAKTTAQLSVEVVRLEAFSRGEDAIVRFGQLYLSERLADYGGKTLWLKRRKGAWAIVAEEWSAAVPSVAETNRLRDYQLELGSAEHPLSGPIASTEALATPERGSSTVRVVSNQRTQLAEAPNPIVLAVNSAAAVPPDRLTEVGERTTAVRAASQVEIPRGIRPREQPVPSPPRVVVERFLAEAGEGVVDVTFRLQNNSGSERLVTGSVLVIVRLETSGGARYLAWPWGTNLIGNEPVPPYTGDPFAIRRFKDVSATLGGLPRDGVLRQVRVIVLDRSGHETDRLSYGH